MKTITCYINGNTDDLPPWDISKATNVVTTNTAFEEHCKQESMEYINNYPFAKGVVSLFPISSFNPKKNTDSPKKIPFGVTRLRIWEGSKISHYEDNVKNGILISYGEFNSQLELELKSLYKSLQYLSVLYDINTTLHVDLYITNKLIYKRLFSDIYGSYHRRDPWTARISDSEKGCMVDIPIKYKGIYLSIMNFISNTRWKVRIFYVDLPKLDDPIMTGSTGDESVRQHIVDGFKEYNGIILSKFASEELRKTFSIMYYGVVRKEAFWTPLNPKTINSVKWKEERNTNHVMDTFVWDFGIDTYNAYASHVDRLDCIK